MTIDQKYQSLGGASGFLGAPEAPEQATPDGVGRYRHYAGGSIYWHPLTDAHEVHGLIRAKWAKLGWERSFLGYPKTDETDSGGGANGRYNLFQGGAVLWKRGASEAFENHGAIRSKFGQMGWEAGFLGFPVTDETKTPDGIGRFNHFEGGSIYWKPSISAHEVHGLIRHHWSSHGWEQNSQLGYPISDELPTFAGSQNRFNDFENGVLYWKHGSSAASPLSKLTLGNASRTASEMLQAISAVVVPKLKSNSRVYIKSGPSIAQITDYSWNGQRALNRQYKVYTQIGIDISGVPDPTCDLNLWIAVDFDPAGGAVWSYLAAWHIHTHVPWPTSMGLSASEVNDEFKAVLNPLVNVKQDPQTVPEPFHLLSVKVMPNGDLDVFVQPLA
jgi:uncharacterized protein with LGFP repeats